MSSAVDMQEVESQRQALEANIIKLRESLKHWQTWEAEYEGLKEEVEGIAGDATQPKLTEIAQNYGGDLVNEKEIRDITGLTSDSPRSAAQIRDLVNRRQEYVQKNIETLQRQYFAVESKLEEYAFASSWSNTEAGALPLTEIHEELDDDGNVLSSHLSQPESAQASLLQSLRKVGFSESDLQKVKDGDDELQEPSQIQPTASSTVVPAPAPLPTATVAASSSSADANAKDGEIIRSPVRKKSVSFTADTKASPDTPQTDLQEKKVSFAPKVAVMPAADPPDARSVSFSSRIEEIPVQEAGPSPSAQRSGATVPQRSVQDELRPSFAPGEKVLEINEDDDHVASHVVIPDNESEEDARIRREMLEYHLNEVGNVVAQIQLDEDLAGAGDDDHHSMSDFTSSEYPDDEDTPYTSGASDDESESEDEFGRSKVSQISPEYREKMLELERRLIGNIGPQPSSDLVKEADPELNPMDVKRLVIRNKRGSASSNASSESSEKKPGQKKRVSFAEGLDIAESDTGSMLPPLKAQKREDAEIDGAAAVSDLVMERAASLKATPVDRPVPLSNLPNSSQPAAAATGKFADLPQGPEGRTLADVLVERPISKPSAAPNVDETDVLTERRQLAAEYYRKRNDMIRQQGGFKARDDDEEEEDGNFVEGADGKPKKVSRFRAARLKGQ